MSVADLLNRLRTWYQPSHKSYPTHPLNPDGEEAAELIEALRTALANVLQWWPEGSESMRKEGSFGADIRAARELLNK